MNLSADHIKMLDDWQHGFPLVPEPYAEVGNNYGMQGHEVIGILEKLKHAGILSRVGVTVRPNSAGASTLAAMQVPQDRLEVVAGLVSREPNVNHNYERDHDFNLWFVVTGKNRTAVNDCLARIETNTGLAVLNLPLEKAYYIDLGFSLIDGTRRKPMSGYDAKIVSTPVSENEKQVLASLQNGLPLISRPFRQVGKLVGLSEETFINHIRDLMARNVIKRFGFIVRHHELGICENAMVVWNVPDHDVDDVATLFSEMPFVTLCYRRPRREPIWPYNLFCMIHGRDRDTVCSQIRELQSRASVHTNNMAILFSKRRFKQRGAHLSAA